MFNPLDFISKFIKSGNQVELDRIAKIVENILAGSHPRKHPRLSEESLCLLLFSGG